MMVQFSKPKCKDVKKRNITKKESNDGGQKHIGRWKVGMQILMGIILICLVIGFYMAAGLYFQDNWKNTPTMMYVAQIMSKTWQFAPSYWISLAGLYLMCDVHDDLPYSGIMGSGIGRIHNQDAFRNIKNGDVVCVHIQILMNDFWPNYLPQYEESNIYFSILTFEKPDSMPTEMMKYSQTAYNDFTQSLMQSKNIIHFYFIDYDGTKIKGFENKTGGIPLGLNYHKTLYNIITDDGLPQSIQQRERRLNKWRDALLTPELYKKRKFKVYAADYMSSHRVIQWMDDEGALLEMLKKFDDSDLSVMDLFDKNKYIDRYWKNNRRAIVRWKSYYELRNNSLVVGLNDLNHLKERRAAKHIYEERSEYVFVLSPLGTGMDCFRTWEALIFGHIVIVQTSALDELYEGLPVVIIEEWNEITKENLEKWAEKYNQTAMNSMDVAHKLTNKYWYDKMKQHTAQAIEKISDEA